MRKVKSKERDCGALVCSYAAKDDSRYAFNGVYMDPSKKLAVATNGRRMIISKTGFDFLYKKEMKAKPAIYAVKPLKAGSIALIDGQFPDYMQVVPDSPRKYFAYDVPEWFGMITKENVPAKLIFRCDEKQDRITVFASIPHDVEPSDFCLNAVYLRELAGKTVWIGPGPTAATVLVLPTSPAVGTKTSVLIGEMDWVAVIMPMKI